ncbi:hypothetical protein CKAH01_05531 [Colletotrichum kahawae]|uniref:Uncharacterized protein n=1 Tax=Colletotrichum kahawae TaxID=34407 RepID=A0AAE0D664_COLKA|nr:hypothetical protein CKAH01_05531 [Colletotrichum kahawae]
MCIFLSRHFSCQVNGAPDTHTHQYLVRCANPLYELCIIPDVLPTCDETYSFPCHGCTGKFIEPVTKPLIRRWNLEIPQSPIPEAPPAIEPRNAQEEEAIISYTHALCDIMIASTVPRWPSIPAGEDHLQLYRTSKMEMACRFSKDHFDKGGLCDCNETNKEPELHNIAVAMRQTVARTYLYPRENTGPTKLLDARGKVVKAIDESRREYAWNDPMNTGHTFRGRAEAKMADQPDLSQLNHLKKPTSVGDIQVIPFFMDIWDNDKAHLFINQYMQHDWNSKGGGVDGWYKAYRSFSKEKGDFFTDVDLDLCMRLINTAKNLVINDSGLTFRRMFQVMRIFENLLFLAPVGRDGVSQPALACLNKLLDLVRRGRGVLRRRHLPDLSEPLGFGGDAWYDQLRMMGMHHHFHRSRLIRKNDEFACATAVQNTVIPLSEEEIAALPEDKRDCAACGEEMGWPLEGHAAMRIKCPSRHLVGMNCWMKACRGKRLLQMGTNDIKCHSCGDFTVGEWEAAKPRSRMYCKEVSNGEYDTLARLESALYYAVYPGRDREPQHVTFGSYMPGWVGYTPSQDHRQMHDEWYTFAGLTADAFGAVWRQETRPWAPRSAGY